MPTSHKNRTISIRLTVLSIFILMSALTAGLALLLQFHFSKELALSAATTEFRNASLNLDRQMEQFDRSMINIVGSLASFPELFTPPPAGEFPDLQVLAKTVAQNDNIYAVYLGYDSGEFYELINLDSGHGVRSGMGAHDSDQWVVVHVSNYDGTWSKATYYFSRHMALRDFTITPTDYNPKRRPWYRQAVASTSIIKTPPYIFSHLGVPGMTYALSMDGGKRVAGVDITLNGISQLLAAQQLNPQTETFLFDRKNRLIASAKGQSIDTGYVAGEAMPYPELAAQAKDSNRDFLLQTMELNGKESFACASRIESQVGETQYILFTVPVSPIIAPYMKKVYYSLAVTCGLLIILLPLAWYLASLIVSPINALALENEKVKQRRYDEVGNVHTRIEEIKDLSRSLVDMATSIQAHEKAERELMDAFIKLIATAIDHKSPYTGGHCARVPEIAEMLCKAASASTESPFKEFRIHNEDEWREFHIAAWLHDCGKVTTPEYIVDKATKLETIHNRIHEIRTRFEVLWRDAELDYYRALLDGGDETELRRTLEARQEELREQFAFVATCNVGGEFMEEEKVDRLKDIASQTWTRHLDDRLGLSHIELKRMPKGQQYLPCEERLLADKPEHVIERPDCTSSACQNTFTMTAPEHLYNLGELYNLSISRGTLTTEDRYKINEHIISTIHMLETLPYPEDLTRVPEYAGAHHETLIGTGYPKQLAAKDLSIPARIMAIADIFEALTASDRPYKKGKTISQTLKIMGFMVKDQHIDRDLFRLFLEKGLHMEYARKHLKPEQIDEVDIAQYL